MKYFIAVEDDVLLKLWMQNPKLVAPLSRPFVSEQATSQQSLNHNQRFKLSELLI